MAFTTVAPILQALVQTLRANATLKAALKGGIHEGPAPEGTDFPWLMYGLHYGSLEYDWSGVLQQPGIDIFILSRDQVEARNLDQLVVQTLHDAALSVSEQSTLFSRRTLELSLTDADEEGHKVYQVGGVHEIWTDQGL